MSLDTPSSFADRRAYYRINVMLPMCLQAETDDTQGELLEQSINLSGGGIGVIVNTLYEPHDILRLTIRFPDQTFFTASIEVLRVDHIEAHHIRTYRLHAQFVGMAAQHRELLIQYIMRFQREHLARHYSA
jgi:c-di-GMP-binding flagellar brake protein YcgR